MWFQLVSFKNSCIVEVILSNNFVCPEMINFISEKNIYYALNHTYN